MEKAPHNSPESDAIRQRMDDVRRDLDKDVQEIVEDARDIRDWRTYVRSYPWACVGAAFVVGYWIAPRRRIDMQPTREMLTEFARQSRLAARPEPPTTSSVSSASSVALSFLGSLLLRQAASYVGQRAGDFLAARDVKSQQVDEP